MTAYKLHVLQKKALRKMHGHNERLIGSRSCPMPGFGTNGVEILGSVSRQLVSLLAS
jgi:hypothetical protein